MRLHSFPVRFPGPVPDLLPRDRQTDPPIGICPRCGRERYGVGPCPWDDCREMEEPTWQTEFCAIRY